METPKEKVRRLLERLPEDVSCEHIQHHICVLEKVERGRREVEQGRTLSSDEVEHRLGRWFGRE